MPLIDMTGERHRRLVVLERGENSAGGAACWVCRCDCGTVKTVPGQDLRSGHSQSCGCLNHELAGERIKHNEYLLVHGHARDGAEHELYAVWRAIRQRCNNPNHKSFHYYGGRGITVDSRWDDFGVFLADVGERPGSGYHLHRVDNDGPYGPSNVMWLTPQEHARYNRALRAVA